MSIVNHYTGCWEWPNNQGSYNYPSFFSITGGRAAWNAFFGVVPDGLFVLHSCDNKRCVNPSHLFLGTRSDNRRDWMAKGKPDVAKVSAIGAPFVYLRINGNRSLAGSSFYSLNHHTGGIDWRQADRWDVPSKCICQHAADVRSLCRDGKGKK